RQAGNGGKSKSRGTQLAEVVQPAEVDGEIRIQRQMIEIGAEFDVMRALHPGEVVRPLVALLYAVHKRERLAPEESHTGNIYCHIAAAGSAREVVSQAAPRILIAELVDLVAANGPGVLHRAGSIVIVLHRGARRRVLAEVLVLGVDLNAGDVAGAHVEAEHELLIVGQPVVQAQRINVGVLFDREVADQAVQRGKRCRHSGTNRSGRRAGGGESGASTETYRLKAGLRHSR